MALCQFIEFRITPIEQDFDIDILSDLLCKSLIVESNKYYVRLIQENGTKYYHGVIDIDRPAFRDCTHSKFMIGSYFDLTYGVEHTATFKKITEHKFIKFIQNKSNVPDTLKILKTVNN